MRKVIVNIIMPIVIDETEAIVAAYPNQSHHAVLLQPDSRRYIITHVLSRMSGMYLAVDETENTEPGTHAYCTPDQRQQIQALVHEGIQQILQMQDSLSTQGRSPILPEPEPQPSRWFG